MKYPKLWDGSNAVGESKVRQLEKIGSPALSASGPGFFARKSGGGNEVYGGEEFPFRSYGTTTVNGKTKRRYVATPSLNQPFRPWIYPIGDYVGYGRVVASTWRVGGSSRGYVLYPTEDYRDPILQEDDEKTRFWWSVTENTWWAKAASAYIPSANREYDGSGREPDSFDLTGNVFSALPYALGTLVVYLNTPRIVPLQNDEDGLCVAVMWQAGNGNHDLEGAPVSRSFLQVVRLPRADELEVLRQGWIPNDASVGELVEQRHSVLVADIAPAGHGAAYVVDYIGWTYPGEESGDMGRAMPKVLLSYTPNLFQTVLTSDITDVVMDGMPIIETSDPLSPRKYADGWFLALNFAEVTSRLIPIGEGEALFSYASYMADPGNPEGWVEDMLFWRLLKFSGVSVEVLDESFSSDEDFPGWLQSIVYCGNDCVMAKRKFGFGHEDGIAVQFEVSYDRGETFSTVSSPPNQSPLESTYYGDLFVIDGPTEDSDGVIGVNAYNPVEGAYFLYVTEDLGESWIQKAKIARSETLHPAEPTLRGVTDGSFQTTQCVGTRAKPAYYLPAIPDFLEGE